MNRSLGVLTIIFTMALAGCLFQPDSLSMSLSSSARATVYEAVYVHKRAVQLYQQGRIRDAIAVAAKALDLFEDALGPMHPCVAVPLRSLAVFYQSQGAYAKAEPLYARVVAIQEKELGAANIGLAQHLDELAALYRQWGAYDKAQPLYARALAMRERKFGPTSPEVVESLNNLALAFEKQGAYGKAEPLYRRALAIAEKVLGPKHPGVAHSLNGLAMLYWAQGTYTQAEPLLVRSLEIRENTLTTINRLGPAGIVERSDVFSAFRSGGMSSRPKMTSKSTSTSTSGTSPGYSATLGLFGDTVSLVNSAMVQGLSNLDELYSTTTPYAQAEPLLTRAADIFETVRKSAQAEVAQSLGNLAQHYVATGDYQRAEPLLVRTLNAEEQVLGAMNPEVANRLNNLAQLYQTQGAYAKAEPLLLRVLDIRGKALGAMHPDVARSLNNLAVLYEMQGAYAKAEPLLVRTVAILEAVLGKTHPDVARSLNNLALLYHEQGAYAQAEPLYRRAIEIVAKLPAGTQPDAVRYLNNLAVLYHATGAPEQAEPLMARAAELREAQLQLELAHLSAPRKRDLVKLLRQETESLVSLHADSTPASPRMFVLALTTVLRRKGLALDSLLDNQAALHAHPTPGIQSQLDRLAAMNTELSTLLHVPVEPWAAAARAATIAAVRTRIETLESDLNAASVALRARSQPVTPEQVKAALPGGAALIEFVHYHRFDPLHDHERWHEARYVAYILTRQGPAQWVALGEAAPIDDAVDAVLAEMHQDPRAGATRAALQHLDALVLEPLRARLGNISHVILSPDGKLNLVPFEALIDPQGRYGLEHWLVSYVTSGRDLLQQAPRQAPRSPPVIVAAPDYGPGRSFVPLDDAGSEAIEVLAHLPGAQMLTGNRATKAALAGIVGPAVLHIATHGFYARDAWARSTPAAITLSPPAALDSLERGMFIEGGLAPGSLSTPLPMLDDPTEALDRAGLALAHANVHPDGIVTARELANYDWWGTQLVVLSACETGVGAVPSGEGVYGLRRALALAGAEAQVVSLWNVSDASVRVLMREFYSELAAGTGRAEALRRAKLRMLQEPKFAHPYYWAAFIPTGAWTPLDKATMRRPGHGH
jgi:CHAT domain-containing protein